MIKSMNKKGNIFKNIIFTFISLLIIAFAIFLLFSATNARILKYQEQANEQKQDYQSVQLLRTYAQTPFTFEGKTMTVAEALNEYYYLEIKKPRTDEEDDLLVSLDAQLKLHAKNNIAMHLSSKNVNKLYSVLMYFSSPVGDVKTIAQGNSALKKDYEEEYGKGTKVTGETDSEGYIVLPVNFPNSPSGSYYIILASSSQAIEAYIREAQLESGFVSVSYGGLL